MLIEEFYSDDKSLKAIIAEIDYIYKVTLLKDEKPFDVKSFPGKSIHYVRDFCENFVSGLIKYY